MLVPGIASLLMMPARLRPESVEPKVVAPKALTRRSRLRGRSIQGLIEFCQNGWKHLLKYERKCQKCKEREQLNKAI